MKGLKRILCGGGLTLLAAVIGSHSYASGYKLEFQSPAVVADGGDAAVVDDASTNWYNSAGLVMLPQQFVIADTLLSQRTQFSGTSTAPSIVFPRIRRFTYVNSGNSSSWNNVFLPAIHYSYPIPCSNIFLGISVVPAWGLLEDYGENASVRYDLTRIYTKSLDIAPSVAMKFNDQWSVGIGPDFHYWYLSSNLKVRTQPVTTGDSISRYSTDSWGYGGHIGILYRPCPTTRIGLNYRSKIINANQGYSDFAFYQGAAFETGNFNVRFTMPAVTSLSIYHAITPCFALMGTVAYDQWSAIDKLVGYNFMSPTGTVRNVAITENLQDSFDVAVGMHYRWSDQLLLRASLRFEQTPTINATRDINFPDQAKLGLNFGSRYTFNKSLALDLYYAHVFIQRAPINVTNTFGANVNGNADSYINLFGAGLVWSIC